MNKSRFQWIIIVGKGMLLSAILLAVTNTSASEPGESSVYYYRHEFNVGIGKVYLPSSQYDYYDKQIYSHFPVRDHNWIAIGYGRPDGLQLGYYYHLNKRFSVGIAAAFLSCNYSYNDFHIDKSTDPEMAKYVDRYRGGKDIGTIKESSRFLLPCFKWSWRNYKWGSLYSKVYAGVHFQKLKFESDVFPAEMTSIFNEDNTYFAYAVAPVGLEAGRKNIRWYAEFSLGSDTNIQTGITYRFGRY